MECHQSTVIRVVLLGLAVAACLLVVLLPLGFLLPENHVIIAGPTPSPLPFHTQPLAPVVLPYFNSAACPAVVIDNVANSRDSCGMNFVAGLSGSAVPLSFPATNCANGGSQASICDDPSVVQPSYTNIVPAGTQQSTLWDLNGDAQAFGSIILDVAGQVGIRGCLNQLVVFQANRDRRSRATHFRAFYNTRTATITPITADSDGWVPIVDPVRPVDTSVTVPVGAASFYNMSGQVQSVGADGSVVWSHPDLLNAGVVCTRYLRLDFLNLVDTVFTQDEVQTRIEIGKIRAFYFDGLSASPTVMSTPTNTKAPSESISPTTSTTTTGTASPTPSSTPSRTVSDSATPTKSSTPTVSRSFSVTGTQTPTSSQTATPSPTESPSVSPSQTPTQSSTPTISQSNTASLSNTPTPTFSATPSMTRPASLTPTITPANSVTPSRSVTPSSSRQASISSSSSRTPSATVSDSVSVSKSLSSSRSASPSTTKTRAPSGSMTMSRSASLTVSPSLSSSRTPTQTPTGTSTPTSSPTPSVTPSVTPAVSPSSTATISKSLSPTSTPSSTVTPSSTPTPSVTPSTTPTPSVTPSTTPTPSVTPSSTPTPSATQSLTPP